MIFESEIQVPGKIQGTEKSSSERGEMKAGARGALVTLSSTFPAWATGKNTA